MWVIQLDHKQAQNLCLRLESLINLQAAVVLMWPCNNCGAIVIAEGSVGMAACSNCHHGPQMPEESQRQPL